MDMNIVVLTGNLAQDPDLRVTASGSHVVNFRIAVNGKSEKDVVFVDVVAWQKQAENIAKYLTKGSRVLVRGELTTNTYTNQANKRISKLLVKATQVLFIGAKKVQPSKSPKDHKNHEAANFDLDELDSFDELEEAIETDDM
ncbi:single-stranded DNA-binding protein [Thermovirga lienii]|jgi:single-strand DNA-binding protein|uniref:single-stranded DNA-binding protein n=1 Tax=Thermovirga lienii TaxID=336261 RepID=UPI002FE3C1FF